MIDRSQRDLKRLIICSGGSILVYIALAMVIFGILGVTMVSLFSTSISSSATQNDTRRAHQYYESGIRYGTSELVNSSPKKMDKTVIDRLNNTIHKLSSDSNFKLKIFGLELSSLSDINDPDPNPTVNLKVEKGLLPSDFAIPVGDPTTFLVIHNTSNPFGLEADPVAAISGFTYQDSTHINLVLGDNIYIGQNQVVTFAVRPFQDSNISQGGNLLLTRNASAIFPRKNGVIEVRGSDLINEGKYFFYSDRIDTDNPNFTKLTNIQNKNGSGFSLDVSSSSTYIILSPAIHIITSQGESGGVIYSQEWNNQFGGSVYDKLAATGPVELPPDIEFDQEADLESVLSRVERSTGNVVNFGGELGSRFVTLSASGGSFGAFWFKDPDGRSIGGVRNFCNNLGGCLFNDGFRAFFILNFTGSTIGDGLAFSIVNASNNAADSIGGDINLSELLAYAGDSRTVSNPTLATHFLDGRSGQGLNAPKFAVEFDGLKNNQFATICEDDGTLNVGTRNDPDFSGADRDTVQYVFWGSNNTLINAPCRINTLLDPDTNRTYDDNRHDAVNALWIFDSSSAMLSSPAIDERDPADIRIYTGQSTENALSNGGRLIRLRGSDGTVEWSQNPNDAPLPPSPPPLNDGDVNSAPELDGSGNIYVGNDDNLLAKYSPGGTKLASIFLDGDIEGKPAVTADTGRPPVAQDTVYVVTDNGSLHAVTKSLTLKWAVPFDITVGTVGGTFSSWPVIRYDETEGKNVIYVGSLDGRLYAVRDDGASGASLNANFPILTGGAIRGTPAINPISGDVYFGSDDGQIRARTSQGVARWAVTPAPSAALVSSPAVDAAAARVYVGSTNGRLYALNDLANGAEIWRYPDPTRTPGDPTRIGDIRGAPVVASDGAVIFGSDDGYLYAVNPSGTLRWKFPAAGSALGAIRSKPAIGANGIIYFSADDGKLYAVDPAVNEPTTASSTPSTRPSTSRRISAISSSPQPSWARAFQM